MKIYTSYFAKGKTLRAQNIVLINIALYPPPNAKCANLQCVAPTHSILFDKYKTDDRYTHRYQKEVLDKLDAHKVLEQIIRLSNGRDVALCCYEKPDDFCHRHILAEWLTEKTGVKIEEFGRVNSEVKQMELF